MDETAIWADMPGLTTIAPIGTKSVPLLTTGHEKLRISVCYTALADGKKLPPLVVFKGKHMPLELQTIPDIVVIMTDNGWMNQESTLVYLNKVWDNFAVERRMLVWDSFRAYITEATKQALRAKNTFMSTIPAGCTKDIQPVDVSWNAPFKTAIRTLYDQWLAFTMRDTTKS